MTLPAYTSPVAADRATRCSPHGPGLQGVPQDHQTPDFTDYCHDMLPQRELIEWDVTEDFEAFLAEGSQPVGRSKPVGRSQPVGSRCAAVGHPGPKESVQSQLDPPSLYSTDESTDDLSDLCLQQLGDFNLSDLDISAAMIDYLLG